MLSKKYAEFSGLIFYQIYPRSFCDSNNDGIGDIKGIISKLDYIKDLGVNAIWLSPCFKSPNDDNGYDIADYRDIMDEFGTLDDCKLMIEEMHKRGLKIIMDLVANHSSTEHKWFKEAKKSKDNPYHDYYYWFDEKPNDWQSLFGGSAWEYDENLNQFYLHSFAKRQADLNWDNPKVRKEIADIVDFWVDLGVDGFRCDVLDMVAKDFELGLNGSGKNLHKYINELFGREKTRDIFTVGECWSANIDTMNLLCGGDRGELCTSFNFEHICIGYEGKYGKKPFTLKDLTNIFSKWQKAVIDNDLLYTLFLENHDQPRSITRFGNEGELRFQSATMLATIILTLRGIPFIFQGQEIGVTNSCFTDITDFDDVEAKNYYYAEINNQPKEKIITDINYRGRDNARRPMPWNSQTNGGFCTVTPWIKNFTNYKKINVENDLKSEKSIYSFYQKLISIRKNSSALTLGNFNEIDINQNCYAFTRELDDEMILVVCNFDAPNNIDLSNYKIKQLLLSNYDSVPLSEEMRPYQVIIAKLET